MSDESNPFATLTAKIVGAFAAANTMAHTELPKLIHAVHAALKQAGEPAAEAAAETAKPTAAQIRKSITPDALISFLDGKPYKMLKRHLSGHGLSIADYKSRFGLPKDYPTTAPNYSAARSALARAAGLGRHTVRPTAPKTRKSVKKVAKAP